MRRIVMLVVTAALAGGAILALPGAASAQTPDPVAFCAARIEANNTQGKKATLAVMDKLVATAPQLVATPMKELRAAYAKQGDKVFESSNGELLLAQLDGWTYENCAGTKVPVTATDYQFSGLPATLPAGVTKFKLTNAAPEENHELIVVKLNAKGEAVDPATIVEMPQKKAEKLLDPAAGGTFMFASALDTAYAPAQLSPGKYFYACFLPEGGKKSGAPHATLGMYGTFTVS